MADVYSLPPGRVAYHRGATARHHYGPPAGWTLPAEPWVKAVDSSWLGGGRARRLVVSQGGRWWKGGSTVLPRTAPPTAGGGSACASWCGPAKKRTGAGCGGRPTATTSAGSC